METHYLCPNCSVSNIANAPPKGVLKTIYDYDSLAGTIDMASLLDQDILPLLPLNSRANLPKLQVGNTPLYEQNSLDGEPLPFRLFLKDDSQNPSFSFKDRASSLVSAYAKENGIDTIIAASTGNAGSSIAGICAAQGQRAIVLVPEKAPVAKLMQIVMYGAQLIPVKGTYDEAFELSIAASNSFGWYNRNTAYNPLTIEGKKTVSFELVQQLKGLVPDIIFVPTGDGVIISGVYKGFEDLLALGLIDKMPLAVAVQSMGSDNLVRNLNKPSFEVKGSDTIADSISVDVPRNFYMAQEFIQKYNGAGLAISDQEILEASKKLSRNTGLFTEPSSAAAFGGFLRFKAENRIPPNSSVVVLLTGSGLKDLETLKSSINIPQAINPDVKSLSLFYSKSLKS
jgi:threonine synthase